MHKSPNIYMFDWNFSPLTHCWDLFHSAIKVQSEDQVTPSELVRALTGGNGWYRKGDRKEESFGAHGISSKHFPSDKGVKTVTLSTRVSPCSHQGLGRDQEHTHHNDGKKFSPELCPTGTSGIAVSNLKPTHWFPDLCEGKSVYVFILFLR